jgi:hypothetical protein
MSGRFALAVVAMVATNACLLVFGVAGQSNSTNPKGQTASFGSSGGNADDSADNKCCSGTLGSLLFSGTKKYILSNNHVIGAMGHATNGAAIIQPGLVDNGCLPTRSVGRFVVAAAITDNVDAAIAELLPSTMDPTGTILGIGLPSGEGVDPVSEMPVQKSGRSTGVTHGTIFSYPTNVNVDYSGLCRFPERKRITFKNQVVIATDPGSPFAATGDSGSLLMTEDKQPVGLLFAGSNVQIPSSPGEGGTAAPPDKDLVAVHPIKDVLARLSTALGSPLSFHPGIKLGAAPIVAERSERLSDHQNERTSTANQMFEKIQSEPSVVGVGVAGWLAEPQLILYLQKDLAPQTLKSAGFGITDAGLRYQGMKVTIVKTGPLRAAGWNDELGDLKKCGD